VSLGDSVFPLLSSVFVLLSSPLVFWAQTRSGTTGVAIQTPGGAVLAMDSRVTLTAGDWVGRGADECKIRPVGRFFFAIAGLYDHEATRFDAWRLAEEAAGGAGSVSEAAAAAGRRIEPELATALGNIQSSDLAGFARHYSQAHLALVVAGVDQGAPAMAGRVFLADQNAAIRMVRWEAPPGSTAVLVFGQHAAIDEAYRDRKAVGGLVGSLGPAEAARRLVQLEITREPERVGPPVSILEITQDGAAWVQPGVCGSFGDMLGPARNGAILAGFGRRQRRQCC